MPTTHSNCLRPTSDYPVPTLVYCTSMHHVGPQTCTTAFRRVVLVRSPCAVRLTAHLSASDGICLCWLVLRSPRRPCSTASCAPETACGTSSCVFPIPSRAPTAPCERSAEAGIPACTSRTVRSVLSVYASSACGCVERTFFPIQALDPAPNCPPRQHPLERQAHPTIAGAPHDCKPSPGTCIAPCSR
jgi:hypothetical protein